MKIYVIGSDTRFECGTVVDTIETYAEELIKSGRAITEAEHNMNKESCETERECIRISKKASEELELLDAVKDRELNKAVKTVKK